MKKVTAKNDKLITQRSHFEPASDSKHCVAT